MSSLDRWIEFNRFLLRFRDVRRFIISPGLDRDENDVEHSYFLFMNAWFISDSLGLKLDISKLAMYALTHDIPEIYAGDQMFNISPEAKTEKNKLEEEARARIAEEFPEFPGLIEAIEEYERKETTEAKFIYALDKVMPVVTIYLGEGETWKREGDMSLEELERVKDPQVENHRAIKDLWRDMCDLLAEEGLELGLVEVNHHDDH